MRPTSGTTPGPSAQATSSPLKSISAEWPRFMPVTGAPARNCSLPALADAT
jgi:hypothetical protein